MIQESHTIKGRTTNNHYKSTAMRRGDYSKEPTIYNPLQRRAATLRSSSKRTIPRIAAATIPPLQGSPPPQWRYIGRLRPSPPPSSSPPLPRAASEERRRRLLGRKATPLYSPRPSGTGPKGLSSSGCGGTGILLAAEAAGGRGPSPFNTP